jgi:hypothetical protein
MRATPLLISALALAAPACGGDDDGGAHVTPAIIPGGGVHDPGIAGEVAVYAIDADDGAPLVGATVHVGDVSATTDATGLALVAGVTGPQSILVQATGHAATLWVGADGGNVTIPLDRSPPDTSRRPQAQLTGSITGWDALPQPEVNHARLALISFAQDPTLGSRANDVNQPPPMGSLPTASCLRNRGPATPCAWKLNARPGAIALGVIVIDVDNRGTADPGDDAQVVTGFSVTPITVVAGMNQTGVMLALPAADSTVRPTIDLGTPPAALTQVAVRVGLDLGSAGVFRLPGIDPTRGGAVVPSVTVAAGATYELLGVAQEPVADGTAAQSIVLRRGATDPTTLAAGTWLEPPTGLASDRTMVSFVRGAATGPYAVQLDNAGLGVEGRRVMTIAILDGSSTVALPLDRAPLPADPLTMRVTTLDTGAAIDLRDFEVTAVTAQTVAAAVDTIKIP